MQFFLKPNSHLRSEEFFFQKTLIFSFWEVSSLHELLLIYFLHNLSPFLFIVWCCFLPLRKDVGRLNVIYLFFHRWANIPSVGCTTNCTSTYVKCKIQRLGILMLEGDNFFHLFWVLSQPWPSKWILNYHHQRTSLII